MHRLGATRIFLVRTDQLTMMRRIRIILQILVCRVRMARIRMRMGSDIKSRKWYKVSLYMAGFYYADVIALITFLLPNMKVQNTVQMIAVDGLAILLLVASMQLLQVGKALSDPNIRRYEGDLKFYYVQERARIRMLTEELHRRP